MTSIVNLAEKLLSERLKKRSDYTRMQYAEAEHLHRYQYENRLLRKQLAAELHKVELLELSQAREESNVNGQRLVVDEEPIECKCYGRENALPVHASAREFNSWHLFVRPWSHVWRKFLTMGIGVCFVLGVLANFGSTSLQPFYAIVMAALLPTTTCVFLGELSRHTAPAPGWGLMAGTFLIGGIISIGLALIAEFMSGIDNPVFAGLIEEPCKGVIVLVLFFGLKQFRSPLAGLFLGAAVGAGFASFETFIYAYRLGGGMPSTAILLLRGVLSPIAHTAWTSAFGGAVWSIRAVCDRKRRGSTCWSAAFILCGMIICHSVFNYNAITSLLSQSTLYVSLFVWGIIFHYIEEGLKSSRKG